MLSQRKMLLAIKTSSFFPLKTHVGEKIENITAIVIHTLQTFGYHYYDCVVFKTNSFCIS